MNGAVVKVNGDTVCGTIDTSSIEESNKWIEVKCEEEVEASSISIEGDNGVSICSVFTLNSDVTLWK